MGDVREIFEKEIKELNQIKNNAGLLAAKISDLIRESGASPIEGATACSLLDRFYEDTCPQHHVVARHLTKIITDKMNEKT